MRFMSLDIYAVSPFRDVVEP